MEQSLKIALVSIVTAEVLNKSILLSCSTGSKIISRKAEMNTLDRCVLYINSLGYRVTGIQTAKESNDLLMVVDLGDDNEFNFN